MGDTLCAIIALSAADILADNRKVILYTKKQLSLGFPLSQVSEMKKTGRGVHGITLDSDDCLVYADAVTPDTEVFYYQDKPYSVKKIRNRTRAAKGQKATLT